MKHYTKDTVDHDDERPSKSQRKREMHDLQALGQTLTGLSPAVLRKLPLDETVLNALLDAQRFKNEALRRQLQYIGKLMRKIDAEPIKQALDKINQSARQANQHFHELENWRDRLVSGDKNIIDLFITQYPHSDVNELTVLVEQAKQEDEHHHLGAGRKLFRYLKDMVEK